MESLPPIIDIEASGFGQGSYPIEIGVIDKQQTPFCCLVRPEPGWQHWNAEGETTHGISRETLLDHGKDVVEVARQLNERLRGQTVYTDAWGHDFSWLNKLYNAANLPRKFKLESIASLLSPAQMDAWNVAKNEVQASLDQGRHRASIDAKIIQLTYLKTQTIEDK
jgi:hypothetical protein